MGTVQTTATIEDINKIAGLQSSANEIDSNTSFFLDNFKQENIVELNGISSFVSLDMEYILRYDGDFLEFGASLNNITTAYAGTVGLFGAGDNTSVNTIGYLTQANFSVRGEDSTWINFGNTNVDPSIFNVYKLLVQNTDISLFVNDILISTQPLHIPIHITSIGNCYLDNFVEASIKYISIKSGEDTLYSNDLYNDSKLTNIDTSLTAIGKGVDQSFYYDLDIKYDGINKLTIMKPNTNRTFTAYEITRENVAPNSDNYGLREARLYNEDKEPIRQITNDGSWEIAIKISGADDFMGGQAHGDDILTSAFCLVDGVEMPLTTPFSIKCRVFELIQASDLFAPSGLVNEGDKVATSYKHWTFNAYTSNCFNHSIKWDTAEDLLSSYMWMIPVLRTDSVGQISDTSSVSYEFAKEDVSLEGHNQTTYIGNSYGGSTRLWAESSGISANVDVVSGWSENSRYFTSASPIYNKMYFDFTGNYTTTVDEVIKAEVTFDLVSI